MGNDPSKKGKKKPVHPKIVSKGKNSSKNLRLLILHDVGSKPQMDAVDHFCDAVNAFKPPGSLVIPSRMRSSGLTNGWVKVVWFSFACCQVKMYSLSRMILICKEGRSWRFPLENVRLHGRNVFFWTSTSKLWEAQAILKNRWKNLLPLLEQSERNGTWTGHLDVAKEPVIQ